MKKNIINNKYFYLILFTIAFVLMFFYVHSFFKYTYILMDDVGTIMTNNSWKNMFDYLEFSCYISTFIDNIFLVLLPNHFNIHPCDFKADYYSLFQTVIMLSFGVLCSFFLSKKLNLLYCISFVFSIGIIIFLDMCSLFPFVMYIASGFSRIFLCIFFFLICLLLLIEIIKKFSVFKYVILIFFLFICGLTHEFTAFLLFCTISFYLLFSYKEFKSNFLIFLMPLITEIVVMLIYFKIGGFVRHSSDYIFSLVNLLKYVPEFIAAYLKHIILGHIIAYIIMALQLFLIFKKVPDINKELNRLKLVYSVLLSLFLFGLMLIFLGRTYFGGGFWVQHDDLKIEYSIILFALNLILLNICLSYKILSYKTAVTIFSLISIFIFAKNYIFYNDFVINTLFKERQNLYKAEKIIRLANYKNKTAFLSDNLIFSNWGILPAVEGTQSNMEYDSNYHIGFLNSTHMGDEINCKVIYTDEDTVNKEFANNGGIFTEEELNDIRFTRLYDKDFITNKE